MTARVAILGTGLIGASIGLRLKAVARRGALEVVGADSYWDHAREAQRTGAVDRTERDPARAVEGASIIVLATPILAMRELMEDIAPALSEGAVVTDTGSTKADILEWARELLPRSVSFVGGHPMAGKTESGPSAAEASLFEDARWAVVPGAWAAEEAVETVRGLAMMMGAKPMFMDAQEHDAYVAAISHLPLMAATALFRLTRASEAWPELSLLAAGGFKDSTRVAGTDPAMAHDIAVTNRTQLVHWLQRYRDELQELQRRIEDVDGEEELFRILAQVNVDYTAFRAGVVGRSEVDEKEHRNVPDVAMLDMVIGGTLAQRVREMQERSDERLAESERRARFGRRG